MIISCQIHGRETSTENQSAHTYTDMFGGDLQLLAAEKPRKKHDYKPGAVGFDFLFCLGWVSHLFNFVRFPKWGTN